MGAPDLGCKTLSEIYLDRKLETKMTLVIHSIPGFQATSDLRLACPLYLNEINSRQCEMHPKPKGTEDSKQAANMRCFDRMCEMHPKPKGTEDSANSSPNNSTALSCEMHPKPKGTEDAMGCLTPPLQNPVRDAPKAERH